MGDENEFIVSRVRQVVDSTVVEHTVKGDFFHPSAVMLESHGLDMPLELQEFWIVRVFIKVGMDRQAYEMRIFTTIEDAEEFANKYAAGTELTESDEPLPIDFMQCFEKGFGASSVIFSAGGDPNFGIIYEILHSAGVINEGNFQISDKVLKWAGEDRIAWAKSLEAENWSSVLQLEYCTRFFPPSSLAYMAAQFEFNYYISQDDYSAGYLMRSIEAIVGGAEGIAEQVLQGRKDAGEAGRRASQGAKQKRLEMFLEEIEKLGDLVGRLPEQVLLDQAFKEAVEKDLGLWKQGRGQQAEYEVLLRSEIPYRQRYRAIFDKTA